MKNLDLSLIRTSLIVFVVVIICSIASIYTLNTINVRQQNSYKSAMSRLRSIRSLYAELIEQQQTYKEYALRFDALLRKGIIGAENRLSWLECLQEISNELQLPELSYTISPQTAFPEEALDDAFADIYASRTRMELRTQLYHEGDLITLLNALRQRALGLPLLDNCEIEISHHAQRSSDVALFPSARLATRCSLDWIQISLEQAEDSYD